MSQERADAAELARQAGIRDHEWLEDQYDAIERLVRLAKEAEREACAECIPSNWCDTILTGHNAVVDNVSDCRPIEAVLKATKERIMERYNG